MTLSQILVIYAAALGLIMGSAINAVVWRLHAGKSWSRGRSQCVSCEAILAPRDLVPVLSWLWLKGKCRYCAEPICYQYPLVEVVTAVLFGWSAAVLPWSTPPQIWALLLWLGVLSLVVALSVYDMRWMLLPDKLMLPAIIMGLVYLLTVVVPTAGWTTAAGYALGALAAGGLFYAIAVFSRGRAMGGGDIKLAFFMGLILSPARLLVAMELSFLVASIIGVGLLLAGRLKRGGHLPFGPYLVLGTIISYLYGDQIISIYLRLSGLN